MRIDTRLDKETRQKVKALAKDRGWTMEKTYTYLIVKGMKHTDMPNNNIK